MLDSVAYQNAKALLAGAHTEAEIQFALTVSRHETQHGDGWKEGEGKGSHNMGAITEPDLSKPHFDHLDSHANGQTFVSHFRVYPSMQAGFLDLARVVLKPNVKAALASGNAGAAVQAMHDNRYFEASVPSYCAALKRNYPLLVKGAGIQPAFLVQSFDSAGGSSSSSALMLAAAALLFLGGKF